MANASDFTDICALWGYHAEEHVVQTGDGYLLAIHRLPYRKGEDTDSVRVNAGPGSITKPVVYLHHGLLMNSEVWVCLTEEERNLPFALVERGYDVWLGNNRGNKYSKKSTRLSPTSQEFWNFSMDQFAFHDIPDSIDYILSTTSQPTLSYIGFSQGTAQAFATLSIHPTLNDKVNCFIALAPAMSPAGLSNGIVDALVKTSPDILFLAFGRRSILSSATMWQSILYPPIFVKVLDISLGFLFNWRGRNISSSQKLAAYPHLYSYTSVKCVVHWFQIIRNRQFQMYDDDTANAMSIGASNYYYKVAKFPTKNIKTPIVLLYGGSDSLVDIKIMLKELPRRSTWAHEVPHFEHLDFLWAQNVETLVHPYVFEALEFYAQQSDEEISNGRTLGYSRNLTAKPPNPGFQSPSFHGHGRKLSTASNASTGNEDSDYYAESPFYDGSSDSRNNSNNPRSPSKGHTKNNSSKSFAQFAREREYQRSLAAADDNNQSHHQNHHSRHYQHHSQPSYASAAAISTPGSSSRPTTATSTTIDKDGTPITQRRANGLNIDVSPDTAKDQNTDSRPQHNEIDSQATASPEPHNVRHTDRHHDRDRGSPASSTKSSGGGGPKVGLGGISIGKSTAVTGGGGTESDSID